VTIVGLRVAYGGREQILPEGVVAVIGADPDAAVRIARPGISRRHAVLRYDAGHWVVQDTASRNGTYHDGTRIQTLDLVGPTSLQLGHPTDGESIELEPTAAAAVSADTSASAAASPVVTPTPTTTSQRASMEPTRVAPATSPRSRDRELDDLVAALRDTMKSVRALTWSVWAMIAATAILAILTLFVGIVGN